MAGKTFDEGKRSHVLNEASRSKIWLTYITLFKITAIQGQDIQPRKSLAVQDMQGALICYSDIHGPVSITGIFSRPINLYDRESVVCIMVIRTFRVVGERLTN